MAKSGAKSGKNMPKCDLNNTTDFAWKARRNLGSSAPPILYKPNLLLLSTNMVGVCHETQEHCDFAFYPCFSVYVSYVCFHGGLCDA